MSYSSTGNPTILIQHKDGSSTPFYASTVNTERGSKLLEALDGSVSGDVIQLGPGTFDCGTNAVSKAYGVKVVGSPGYSTVVTTKNTVNMLSSLYPEDDQVSYNIATGLRNWRKSLGMCGKNSAGTGFGGIDVLWCGSSTMEGGVCKTPVDAGVHILKRMLQSRLNPSGVQGGYGFVPFLSGAWSTGLSDIGFDGSREPSNGKWKYFKVNGTYSAWLGGCWGPHCAAGTVGPQTAAETHVTLLMDGTHASAIPFRFNADKFQFVLRETTTSGFTYDVGSSEPITIGAGSPTGTVADGTGDAYGKHLPANGIALTRTAKNYIQLAPAVGKTVRLDGGIAYDGDWDCGCRVHGLGLSGTVMGMADGSAAGWAQPQCIEAVQRFGAATGGGAVQAKLVVNNAGQNDCNIGIPVATFKANYGAWIAAMKAMASAPSVLLIVPVPKGGESAAYYSTTWPAYVAAIYELADIYGCAIFDLNLLFPGNTSPWDPSGAGAMSALGWDGDGTAHYTDLAYWAQSEMLFRLLTSGI